ncbi:MAG: serine kinase, partial [Anaerolineae bacterium]|nr:serine kinase [Anaerolineae bacterium]
MTVEEIVAALGLQVVVGQEHLSREISGGYASDLLSCVMAGAGKDNVWVTLQAHPNVIAVAELIDLACVIITEGTRPQDETLAKAKDRGIPVLLAQQSTFTVAGQLYGLGLRALPRSE